MFPSFNKIFKNKEAETIRDVTIKTLYPLVRDYSEWYANHGLHLPPDYATDPSKWTVALQKMERAFRLLYKEAYGEGELWEAKNKWKEFGEKDIEVIEELEREIIEGMILFGSQLFYLTDSQKKDVE